MGPDHNLYTVTTTRARAVLILQRFILGLPAGAGRTAGSIYLKRNRGPKETFSLLLLLLCTLTLCLGANLFSALKINFSFCCHLLRLQILLTVKKTVETSDSYPFHLFVLLFFLSFCSFLSADLFYYHAICVYKCQLCLVGNT